MSSLTQRHRPPLRPAVASNEPQVIREVISERVELRGEPGEPGKPGKDGKDGVNAFPTGSEVAFAHYRANPIDPSSLRIDYIDASAMTTVCAAASAQQIELLPGHYRVIIGGVLGDFCPFGIQVTVIKSDVNINISNLIPPVLVLPGRLANMVKSLRLQITVEYVRDDAAG